MRAYLFVVRHGRVRSGTLTQLGAAAAYNAHARIMQTVMLRDHTYY